eukprot:TRINITY_DN1213_c0_g1_i1.p1 TRINITY_DN1213_c0_g1~~TRINITY_DN1213_c0_g1_i1.p1  ORF type:complete len:497 (+),score=155.70 TRINITY_DN1213_c0_g1_i1:79-1569(+)
MEAELQNKEKNDNNNNEQEEEKEKYQIEKAEERESLFSDISAENSFTEMESLCMACEEQGITRLLLTRIPHFKEIIIMAFSCPHCHYRSNEVQSGGIIAEKGETLNLRVTDKKDLNRQIVKSETATIRIPEIDFEIPSNTQRGSLNTIEGFLMQTVEALKSSQEDRARVDPEVALKVAEFIVQLENISKGETLPFTFILDDVAGNSFVENPYVPKDDPNMTINRYNRTQEQNFSIGLTNEETPEEIAMRTEMAKTNLNGNNYQYGLNFDKFNYKEQIMSFQGNCGSCHSPSETRMFAVNIPYFKEVIIMASTCDYCGYKSSECKAGGAISEKGKKLTLRVETVEDLNRDILKSETASIYIPEKDLKLTRGTLGGRFTTVEGLLQGVKEDLMKTNAFLSGDSGEAERKGKFSKFLDQMDELIEGKEPFTLIMEDPVANSYILSLTAPDPDPQLQEEEYERSWKENEELGLNDMKTEGYEEEEEEKNEETEDLLQSKK